MTQAVIDNSPQTPTEEKTSKLNKVALVMIVKNEARKVLVSVAKFSQLLFFIFNSNLLYQ